MNVATIREEMAQLKHKILESYAADPTDFDSREPLWARRECLRAQLTR